MFNSFFAVLVDKKRKNLQFSAEMKYLSPQSFPYADRLSSSGMNKPRGNCHGAELICASFAVIISCLRSVSLPSTFRPV